MKQSEQLENEENTFLSLCSPHDRELLIGNNEMTLQDFERITYLTMALDFMHYTQLLHSRHMEFTDKLSAQLDRENDILREYPSYYLDEQVYEKQQKWVEDFLNHIPADKLEYYREKFEAINKYI